MKTLKFVIIYSLLVFQSCSTAFAHPVLEHYEQHEMENDIALEINGDIFTGWQELTVSRSIERVFHTYEFAVANDWRGDNKRKIKGGAAVKVWLGDELISTGYIDDPQSEYDDTSHFLSITGRSKTQDMVDSTLEGQPFKKQNLFKMAAALAKPFDIAVVDVTNSTQPFKYDQSLDEGQSPFDFLEQMARVRAVRLMETPAGELLITRAGTQRSDTALVLGKNIRKANTNFSQRQRFSEYIVLSQEESVFNTDAKSGAQPRGHAVDKTIRYRPLTIVNDNPGGIDICQQRADWQMRTALGRSESIVYTTMGWVQDSGKSWPPNVLVPIDDDYEGIKGDRLLVESRLKVNARSGKFSELMMMPKSAFDLEPLPEPESTDAWTA